VEEFRSIFLNRKEEYKHTQTYINTKQQQKLTFSPISLLPLSTLLELYAPKQFFILCIGLYELLTITNPLLLAFVLLEDVTLFITDCILSLELSTSSG